MNWKDFFYFSHRERQGLFVLLILLIGIMIGKFLFSEPNPEIAEQHPEPIAEKDNTPLPPSGNETAKITSVEPNTKTTSSSRTYYVREKKATPPQQPQVTFPKTEKLQPGATIELNAADSTMLCKIPGIGPAFSRRIVAYRNLLGGFHRKEQLQEVYGMYVELYEKIIPYLEIQTDSIRKIPINSYSLDRLRSHPYINFYQAKAIVEIRKKSGRLENTNQLSLLEEFSESDLEKLNPYFDFDR